MNLEEARTLAENVRNTARRAREATEGLSWVEASYSPEDVEVLGATILELADEIEHQSAELSKYKEFLSATTRTVVNERRAREDSG